MADTTSGRDTREGRSRAGPFFGFGAVNAALFAAGAASIVVGYVLLDRGSVTAAPVLLVLGYLVLLPAAIFVRASGSSAD